MLRNAENIIVIEDDPAIGSLLCAIFEDLGHHAQLSMVPEEAYSIIRKAHDDGNPFTVASVDKYFEVGSAKTEFPLGERLIKKIKSDFPYIATIMITAQEHSPQEVLELRDEYQVDQFLHKNNIDKMKALEEAVQRATERVSHHIATGQIPYEPKVTPAQYNLPDVVLCKPIFGVPHEVSVFDCDVFMIMPFAASFQPIYEGHVAQVVRELGLTIKRGDDWYTKHDIMSEVWSAIYASKFVIADCTGNNANVFYELGMAHTLGKSAIMITQADTNTPIPFDIRARRVIKYTHSPDGLTKLEHDLRGAIQYLQQQGWEADPQQQQS